MTTRTIVTAGSAYVDIDVLACAPSLAEALTLANVPAVAILTPPFNQTIPASIRQWRIPFANTFSGERAAYMLVDVSDPAYFENFVQEEAITAIFDHHYGFDSYWRERLKEKARIESVGACATLIWEEIIKLGVEKKLCRVNYNLLYTAIFANTLNFQAQVSTARDQMASQQLAAFIDLPKSWQEEYYSQIECGIEADMRASLQSDTKTLFIGKSKIFISQLELWHAKMLLNRQASFLDAFLREYTQRNECALVNIISIAEGKNYIFSNATCLLENIAPLIGGQMQSKHALCTHSLWLRKQLHKVAKQHEHLWSTLPLTFQP